MEASNSIEIKNKTTGSFYLVAHTSLAALLVSLLFSSNDSILTAIFALISMVFFLIAFFIDVIESTDELLKNKTLKYLSYLAGALISTYGLINANASVNAILGVDASNAPITVVLLTFYHILKDGSVIIGAAFFIFMILLSPFLAVAIIPSIPDKVSNTIARIEPKSHKKDQPFFPKWLLWVSRIIALFFIFVLSQILNEQRPRYPEIFTEKVLEFMYFADFNLNNHCTGKAAGKPTLFIGPNRVLIPNENPEGIQDLFRSEACYSLLFNKQSVATASSM